MAKGIKSSTILHYALIVFLLLLFLLGGYFIFNTSSETVVAVLTPTFAPIFSPIEAPAVEVPVPLSVVEVSIDPTAQAKIDELTNELAEARKQNPVDTTDLAKCPDTLIRQGNQLLLYNSKQPLQYGINPIKFNNLDEYIQYIKVQRTEHGQYCPVLYLQQESNAQGQDVYRIRPSPFNPQAGLPVQSQATGFSIPPSLLATQGPNSFSSARVAQQASLLQLPQNPLLPSMQPVSRLMQTPPPLTPYVDSEKQLQPNQDGYYGFDPTSQYVGRYTILDQIHQSTETQNPNTGLSTNPMDPNWAGALYTNVPTTFPSSDPPLILTSGMKTPAANTTPMFAANTAYDTNQVPITSPQEFTPEDPMNPNWAGGYASLQSVNKGDYAGNSIVLSPSGSEASIGPSPVPSPVPSAGAVGQ